MLEDDAELSDDFKHVVEMAVKQLPLNWDFLGLADVKHLPHRRLSQLNVGRYLVRYAHFPKTTTAYVLSQSGCRKLLASRLRTRPVDVDIRYGWELGFESYGILSPVAWPSERFASSIPKSRRRRFYWRADPLGYLKGRIGSMHKLGWTNAVRAYFENLSSPDLHRQRRTR